MPLNRLFAARSLHQRSGMTLVEVLVVISILGVLFSLTAVVLSRSRSAARDTGCQNNLRRLAQSICLFESIRGQLPAMDNHLARFPISTQQPLSFHVALLPYLDMELLDEHLNQQLASSGSNLSHVDSSLYSPHLKCPSDPAAYDWPLATNYVGNWGPALGYGYGLGVITSASDEHGLRRRITMDDLHRGQSNTCMLSEVAVYRPGVTSSDRGRVRVVDPLLSDPLKLLQLLDACRNAGQADGESTVGVPWFVGQLGATGYTHGMTPNSHSCQAGDDRLSGLFTPSSHHPGGVYVALADGSVCFVADDIDPGVWTQRGARQTFSDP